MSDPDLFAGLTDELPAIEPAIPVAYLDDDLLPRGLPLVEPIAFLRACAEAAWGRLGPATDGRPVGVARTREAARVFPGARRARREQGG